MWFTGFNPSTVTAACVLLGTLSPVSAAVALDKRATTETSTPTTTAASASTTDATAASATAAATDSPSTTTTASKSLPTNTGNFPICHHVDSNPYPPFCLPNNETEVYVGQKYYVTWDPDYFNMNTSVTIELNYANVTGNSGQNAYSSARTDNTYGYVTITMDKEWLQEEDRNNLTLYMVQFDGFVDQQAHFFQGPTISLVTAPAKHYPPPNDPQPDKLGLMIGLPVGLGGFFLILLGLYIGMRKHRNIGLGNIMGSRNKGYGIRKARWQRTGGQSRTGTIRLGEYDNPAHYTDDPDGVQRVDPDLYNAMERTRGNVFREEIARLKSWK